MTLDNGLDAQLPISKEGLLAALDTQLSITRTAYDLICEENARSPKKNTMSAQWELSFAIEGLHLLMQNIKDDACNNYPPVVRKRFKNDPSLL